MPRTVRVTFPTATLMLSNGHVRIPVGATGEDWVDVDPAKVTVEIEDMPADEPDWQPGDAARDAFGLLFLRTESGRWKDAAGMTLEPVPPMRRLVVEP